MVVNLRDGKDRERYSLDGIFLQHAPYSGFTGLTLSFDLEQVGINHITKRLTKVGAFGLVNDGLEGLDLRQAEQGKVLRRSGAVFAG